MEKENKKIAFIDLDGTFLDDNKKISKKNLEAISKLKKNNVIKVITTGRSLFATSLVINNELDFDYCIFSTGGGILNWKTKEFLETHNFSKQETSKILKFLLKENVDFMIHQTIPNNHNYFYHKKPESEIGEFCKRADLYGHFCAPYHPDTVFEESAQFLVVSPKNKDFEIFEKMKKYFPNDKYSVIMTTSAIDNYSTWIEIFPAQVSKAKSAKRLTKLLNISHENTMAIGNDYNDHDLLDWAYSSYAVANAPKDLCGKCKIVSSNINSGFAEAVDDWLK